MVTRNEFELAVYGDLSKGIQPDDTTARALVNSAQTTDELQTIIDVLANPAGGLAVSLRAIAISRWLHIQLRENKKKIDGLLSILQNLKTKITEMENELTSTDTATLDKLHERCWEITSEISKLLSATGYTPR